MANAIVLTAGLIFYNQVAVSLKIPMQSTTTEEDEKNRSNI